MTETFTVGEEATYAVTGRSVRVAFGPYKGQFTGDEDMYLVTFLDGVNQGRSAGVRASKLERKPKYAKDDKVLVLPLDTPGTVAAGPFDHASGEPHYVVQFESGHTVWASGPALAPDTATPANAYTHVGVTYDLTAAYLDEDAERWEFTGGYSDDGMPLMTLEDTEHPYYKNRRLSSVAFSYGPLHRA
ncbi:phiSA1p31-related protein [Streptomyces albidoflavus]